MHQLGSMMYAAMQKFTMIGFLLLILHIIFGKDFQTFQLMAFMINHKMLAMVLKLVSALINQEIGTNITFKRFFKK